MSKQARFRVSELTKIQKELATLPERSPDEISCREAVAMLFPQIQALRHKGYSLADIAKFLTERGFAITEAALKKYLGEMARAGGKTKRVRRVTTAEAGGGSSNPEGGGTADVSPRDAGVELSAAQEKIGSASVDAPATPPPVRAQPGAGSGAGASTAASAPLGSPKAKAGPSGWTPSVSVGTGTQPPQVVSLAGEVGGTSSATPAGGASRVAGSGTGKDA